MGLPHVALICGMAPGEVGTDNEGECGKAVER
jgi:hypothetical protein